MAVHLNQYHLVPLARTAGLMQDLYGAQLCHASIQSFAQEAALALRPTVGAIAQAVQGSAVVHADETGIHITGRLHWLHCAVTTTLTWLAPHPKRGTLAILRERRQEVWHFMTDADVPFTNNLAEQALRMAKVKQKISGCFRTAHGADTFSTIRSYLATMTKQRAICLSRQRVRGQTIQPCFSR